MIFYQWYNTEKRVHVHDYNTGKYMNIGSKGVQGNIVTKWLKYGMKIGSYWWSQLYTGTVFVRAFSFTNYSTRL